MARGGGYFYKLTDALREILRFLAGVGVSLDSKPTHGQASICLAVSCRSEALFHLLHELGASLTTRDKGRPLAYGAAEQGSIKMLTTLCEAGVNLTDPPDGRTDTLVRFAKRPASHMPILTTPRAPSQACTAASSRSVETLAFVVGKGCNVNCRDNSGRSPAKIAVSSGNLDMVKLLCDAGAILAEDALDTWGDTMVRMPRRATRRHAACAISHHHSTHLRQACAAVKTGSTQMVTFVAARGVDLNARDRNGRTPAYIAVSSGNLDMVKVLCDLGAVLVSAPDSYYGDTLVIVSAERGANAAHADSVNTVPLIRHARR